MDIALRGSTWHGSLGALIERLDRADFWRSLAGTLGEFAPVDNSAALIFSNSTPLILSFMEEEREEVEPDPLISRYITGLYRQDPFYLISRTCRHGGLYHLPDIVSEQFEATEYYNAYFSHYVVTDEVQYNVPLDHERTLCLSLGSESRFGAEQIALFELLRPWVIALMKKRVHFEGALREEVGVEAKVEDMDMQAWKGLISPLTARESDVIRLMLDGHSNKEIADRLALSIATIKVHRRHIYAKLNVKSHSEVFALLINSPAPRAVAAR
ncbi:helix-turn-helix transcriptional regulator [Pseudomonas aeruginosa]|uniref:Transcriptional regulator, LuxR family n=1 Tax=Pseudomonas paraeruginosa (strain DSM 24068 / PA7) TaxID=381754 RepID=A6V4I6_PSEP7|nr:LuxR C-terminal-related transcriptional regulator [Pseudomonas aeruginosa]NQA98236.1 response regulator transcription factor [Pseudomonas paraeruginosa]ABR82691.1 transcriptional regulator, LuxR family [Pseudomonas aeruginosa PA7]KSC82079.1 helix-turn-helix transcriptional regulator [Pseudomonas aeruginosa]KSD14254.1 helix-turn-helix transcriptional regulator [Pseudomonas aeruginosa]MCW8359793.1 LuxR C-terminal-related transcriptional regulator [Pseudomonas aeruginosa]